MMRHHQRPGGERHELPGHQEGEGVVGQDDEVHAGEEGRIERQHALRRFLVAAIAEREEARGRAAEIDDDQEERGQRVDAEMRAEPGQAERQRSRRCGAPDAEQADAARSRTGPE